VKPNPDNAPVAEDAELPVPWWLDPAWVAANDLFSGKLDIDVMDAAIDLGDLED